MSKLFNFVTDQNDFPANASSLGKVVGQLNVNESKSDRLVPIDKSGKYINVVQDYKWTKTTRGSEGRKDIPTVELEEFTVTTPAFFSNLNIALQLAPTTGEGIAGAIGQAIPDGLIPESISTTIGEVGEKFKANIDALNAFVRESGFTSDPNEGTLKFPSYLKSYENLYGVRRTGFKYKVPYLGDTYKNVANGWGGDAAALDSIMGQGAVKLFETVFGGFAPGVGIDYSKTFTYNGDGPAHEIKFYLDNTADSDYEVFTGGGLRNFERNFRLIYLLLYQNLPNRVNKVTFVPPVIYRAKLAGVFSYRWSFISKINVNMVGVRRNKIVRDFIKGKNTNVVIPEGYEITFEIKSLIPESQNLYYDAFDNSVVSTQE